MKTYAGMNAGTIYVISFQRKMTWQQQASTTFFTTKHHTVPSHTQNPLLFDSCPSRCEKNCWTIRLTKKKIRYSKRRLHLYQHFFGRLYLVNTSPSPLENYSHNRNCSQRQQWINIRLSSVTSSAIWKKIVRT